jgi:class 3 adenylate cyclase
MSRLLEVPRLRCLDGREAQPLTRPLHPNFRPKHDAARAGEAEWNPGRRQRVARRLAAIFAADVAGYSRLERRSAHGSASAISPAHT